ncbi:MAG: response regulator transcription factor [Bacteroidales bacterium]|nr:response regulator transcription factor [Bacteroidales bacterium]MBO5942827.1 response regulator transcription factor [Bacteroidales bacterium]
MGIFCLILFMSAVSLWFFTNEQDTLFGVYSPTCAIRTRNLHRVVLLFFLPALFISAKGSVAVSAFTHIGPASMDCSSVLLALMSSFIILLTLKFFSIKASVVYAFVGALAAWRLVDGQGLERGFMMSFIGAPVMAFILSAGIRALLRGIFSRTHIHMITLSHYMRLIAIICIILTAAAVGFNWGGFVTGVGHMIASEKVVIVLAVVIAAIFMILSRFVGQSASEDYSALFAEFSIYSVVSVGLSVAATLLFFSFDATTHIIYMSPAPLSVSALVMSSIAGAEAAQRSRMVSDEYYVREGIAMVAAPAGAFLLTFMMLKIKGVAAEDAMVSFVVMAASLLILVSLAFAGYARGQRSQREATDRILYAQRQQIYEHSRALSDMELKVVLSENQALHNAVEQKRQEVMNVALSIVEQKEFLESLDDMVSRLAKTDDPKEKDRLVAELSSALKQRLSYDSDVDSQYFYAQAESLHEDFNAKLSENFPNMTQQERRLATLLRLGFSSKYIATLMNITPKSVEISRYRLRQKLGLGKGDNLVNFIKSI